ncbi:transmembrane protein 238-like [Mantella aurantiaca]
MSCCRPKRLVGRCPLLFLLALCFDMLGVGLILTGVFANLQLDGRSFGEFIIYGGGILIFFSLLWWLGWYSFNLEVSMEELLRESHTSPKDSNLIQLARKFSERLSKRDNRKMLKGRGVGPSGVSPTQLGRPVHLTPTIIINSQLETPSLQQKNLELSTISSLCGHLEAAGVQVVVDRLV